MWQQNGHTILHGNIIMWQQNGQRIWSERGNLDAARDIIVWKSARCARQTDILWFSPLHSNPTPGRERTNGWGSEATLLEQRAGHRFQWRTQPMWRSPCELAINLYPPITPVSAAAALIAIAVSVVFFFFFFFFFGGGRGGVNKTCVETESAVSACSVSQRPTKLYSAVMCVAVPHCANKR